MVAVEMGREPYERIHPDPVGESPSA